MFWDKCSIFTNFHYYFGRGENSIIFAKLGKIHESGIVNRTLDLSKELKSLQDTSKIEPPEEIILENIPFSKIDVERKNALLFSG